MCFFFRAIGLKWIVPPLTEREKWSVSSTLLYKVRLLGHAQRASWDRVWEFGAGTACWFDNASPMLHSESEVASPGIQIAHGYLGS